MDLKLALREKITSYFNQSNKFLERLAMEANIKKPTGDDAIFQEMLKNKEVLRKQMEVQMAEAAWEAKKRIVMISGTIFLAGFITGSAVYGFLKYRQGSNTDPDE